LFGIGGFSLVALFDGINQVDQATIDSIAGGQFRFLEQEEIGKFFDADDDELFSDDAHANDTPLNAIELKTVTGFVDSTRYEVVGSIADAEDVDFYQIKSPETAAEPLDVMTLLVRSLDPGGLIPKASLFDGSGQSVAATLLANGGGETIIQVDGVTADDHYQVKIEADDSAGLFNTGNYNLVVAFGSQATQLDSMSSGTVGAGTTRNIHTVYIGQPQLFHLALEVNPATTTVPTVVVATINSELGEPVYQIAARPGETHSRAAVLLETGTYTVEVVPLTLDGSVAPVLSYALLGVAISDPFVGDPDDPNAHPFACTEPGMEGFFCYPGGFVSPDPFLWDNFIDSLTDPLDDFDLPTIVTLLFGDWWSWVWNDAGVNGPPFGMPDTIQVPASTAGAASSLLGPTGSVLDNDIDPENGLLVALLQSGPANGSLNISEDGTFVYTPISGFRGRDEFTYTAFDFTQQSDATTVTIVVGESGDFDVDGDVDGSDFLAWQRGLGATTGAALTDGDSDLDGDVDTQDLTSWQQQFAPVPIPSTADFDRDGDFDGSDFLAWQRGFGTPTGASSADGDADADRDVDRQDLAIWQGDFPAGTAATAVAGVGGEAVRAVPADMFAVLDPSTPKRSQLAVAAANSTAVALSSFPTQFVPEGRPFRYRPSASFFLELPSVTTDAAIPVGTAPRSRPDRIDLLPSRAAAQFDAPQTLASRPPITGNPRSRQIEAHDRALADFGRSRLRDHRSDLTDYFELLESHSVSCAHGAR
jgi:hypothetical protein